MESHKELAMKKNVILSFLSIGFILAISTSSCAIRRSEPIQGNEFTYTDSHVENGEGIYMSYCQKCHPGGEGGLGPSINGIPGFMKKFQTRHGLGVMPAFKKDEISKSDLRDIMRYLKAWNTY